MNFQLSGKFIAPSREPSRARWKWKPVEQRNRISIRKRISNRNRVQNSLRIRCRHRYTQHLTHFLGETTANTTTNWQASFFQKSELINKFTNICTNKKKNTDFMGSKLATKIKINAHSQILHINKYIYPLHMDKCSCSKYFINMK